MPRRVSALAVACALCAPWSGAALAQDVEKPAVAPVPGVFQRLIRSGVTRENFLAQVMTTFRQAAQPGTELDQAKIDAARALAVARQRGSVIGAMLASDLDGDGAIDRSELVTALGQSFTPDTPPQIIEQRLQNVLKYDLDGDGRVDAGEIVKAAADQARQAAPKPDAALYLSLAGPSKTLRAADLMKAAEKAFDSVDVDGDTVVSQSELDAFRTAAGLPVARSRTAERVRAFPPPAAPPKRGPDEEVYFVGVYQGFTGERGAPHGPKALVALDRPGKKITLILCSYEAVRWAITLTPETELKEIKSYGANARSEFFVADAARQADAIAGGQSCPYEAKGINFRKAISLLAPWTGFARLDGFAGTYTASKTGYVIDKPSATPELAPDYLKPVTLDGLPQIKFGAVLRDGPGLYDLSGRLVEKGARGDGLRTVDVPARRERYQIADDGLQVVSLDRPDVAKAIPTSLDVPNFSWPSGIAYDGRRNRIVVVSFGGEGFLYEYLIDAGKWRVVASMQDRDVTGLVYDEKSDLVWTVTAEGLLGFDADGRIARKVRPKFLPGYFDVFDPGNDRPSLNLSAIEDGQAVLIVKGGQGHRIYLVDLASSVAKLTGVAN